MAGEYENAQTHFETRINLSTYAARLYQIQVKPSKALIHRILIKEQEYLFLNIPDYRYSVLTGIGIRVSAPETIFYFFRRFRMQI